MTLLNKTTKIIIIALAVTLSSQLAFGNSCDTAHVALKEDAVVIQPNNTDDTLNLSCAMHLAISTKKPMVKLAAGEFQVRYLEIESFNKVLQGFSRAETVINLLENPAKCYLGSDDRGSGLTFYESSPTIRYMTIKSHKLCPRSPSGSAINITGPRDLKTCADETVSPVIDRVSFEQVLTGTYQNAITVFRDQIRATECTRRLTGQLLVNRSSFANYDTALKLQMHGNALVNIRYSEFLENRIAVESFNSSHDITIFNSQFLVESSEQAASEQIRFDLRGTTAPLSNRYSIIGNQFDVLKPDETYSAISLTLNADVPNPVVQISNNIFTGFSTTSQVTISGISSGVISKNQFYGEIPKIHEIARAGFISMDGFQGEILTGWTIMENDFSGLVGETVGLYFYPSAQFNVFGAGQEAIVWDYGGNYYLL